MYCRRATKNILLQRYILTWCNWEFFREGEVFWNKGTSISISSTAHEKNQDIFLENWALFFKFQKGAGETSFHQLLACLEMMITLKKFNARLLFASIAKVDNKYSSKLTSSFFFICASHCQFRVLIYLTPFELILPLLPLLYRSNLLSISSSKVFAF